MQSLQSQVPPPPETGPGNGSGSLLETLQSWNLGHLYSLLSAEGFEIKNLSELRDLAKHLTKDEFLATMKDVGVTNILERVKLYALSSNAASQPVE